jgi:pimeloyl-ACP methyl ester carboxylesterase
VTAERKERSKLRKWISRVWVTFGVTFMLAMAWSYQAHGVDPAVLESDSLVRVTNHDGYLEFSPLTNAKAGGLLFFPGGMVQQTAYAPMARHIAEAGYRVVLVRLPFLGRHAPSEDQKLEVTEMARRQMRAADSVVQWVVAGHSFGGLLASRLAEESPELIDALVLIGTTHPRDIDLSGSGLAVTKILGTQDGVATVERARANADRLPPATRWVEIEGANHAQFGYYGFQLGDGRASITREDQQRQLVEEMLRELARVVLTEDKPRTTPEINGT